MTIHAAPVLSIHVQCRSLPAVKPFSRAAGPRLSLAAHHTLTVSGAGLLPVLRRILSFPGDRLRTPPVRQRMSCAFPIRFPPPPRRRRPGPPAHGEGGAVPDGERLEVGHPRSSGRIRKAQRAAIVASKAAASMGNGRPIIVAALKPKLAACASDHG